jgi:uncharacterized membrane-anchored protein YitT (DUF2179 family)
MDSGRKDGRLILGSKLCVIFSVVTRLELQRLKTEIAKIDPEAFVVENSVNDIRGGNDKKAPLSGRLI